ncbi:BrnT family toxin [Crocosphaera sp.]|uniref:BrnT family toxin n=1 Tax=Crocosphaera sp. TaxID=2729996 RepID=UPI003F27CD86|nr:BrnT family toxin [Crocosphaera sp.]
MNIPQFFEWDENKRQANIEKHGIDFADLERIFTNPFIQRIDNRIDYGETRIILLGQLDGVILYIVYTWRGNVCRFISARRANQGERNKYHQSVS